jgi:hypothetical protein
MVDGDRAGQIGQEHERSLEDRDEHGLATRVIGRDLSPELGYARTDLLLGEVDLSDARNSC